MYDLIIIGGGASGQAAAMYAIGKQINFLMIYEQLGGRVGERLLMRTEDDVAVGHILVHFESVKEVEKEDHLVGSEAVHLFESQVMAQKGHVLRDHVTNVTQVDNIFQVETQRSGVRKGIAVIVATGDTPGRLAIPGADELLIQGLGYSSATHAEMLPGKTVAVIGVTERALHGAAELAQVARQVYLITPEPLQMTTPIAEALTRRPNVELLEDYHVKAIIGGSELEQLAIERAGQVRHLDVDVGFVALPLIPNSDIVRHIVETDSDGFIKVNERNATNVPGLFAAGEVTTIFGREVLIAVGEGARAAVSAHDYLLAQPGLRKAAR